MQKRAEQFPDKDEQKSEDEEEFNEQLMELLEQNDQVR